MSISIGRGVSAIAPSTVIHAKSSVTTLGDSLHAFGANSTDGLNSNSPFLWCNDLFAQYGAQFDLVSMLAVGGKTIEAVISEQLPTALIDGTDIAHIHVGTNNLNASIGNTPISTMMTYFRTLITALAFVKKFVIVDSLNPLDQGGISGARPRAYLIPQVNYALMELCSELNYKYGNIFFNDQYSSLVDPTNASLNPLANHFGSDGTHYTSLGAQSAGYASARNILSRLRITPYKVSGANLLPAFSGTGGTTTVGGGSITGSMPANWNCTVASGAASVVISTKVPDMISFDITNAGAIGSTINIQALNNSTLLAACPNGTTVQGKVGYQATNVVNMTRLNCALRFNSSVVWNGGGVSSNEPTIIYPSIAFGGFRGNLPYAIGSTLSNVEFIIAVNVGPKVGAINGTLTLDLFNPTFNGLT